MTFLINNGLLDIIIIILLIIILIEMYSFNIFKDKTTLIINDIKKEQKETLTGLKLLDIFLGKVSDDIRSKNRIQLQLIEKINNNIKEIPNQPELIENIIRENLNILKKFVNEKSTEIVLIQENFKNDIDIFKRFINENSSENIRIQEEFKSDIDILLAKINTKLSHTIKVQSNIRIQENILIEEINKKNIEIINILNIKIQNKELEYDLKQKTSYINKLQRQLKRK